MQTLKKRVGGVVVIQSALKTLATPITLTSTVDPEASSCCEGKNRKWSKKGSVIDRKKIPHFCDCCSTELLVVGQF
jgi:hypothetical protein